jgi:hypothetical protein
VELKKERELVGRFLIKIKIVAPLLKFKRGIKDWHGIDIVRKAE